MSECLSQDIEGVRPDRHRPGRVWLVLTITFLLSKQNTTSSCLNRRPLKPYRCKLGCLLQYHLKEQDMFGSPRSLERELSTLSESQRPTAHRHPTTCGRAVAWRIAAPGSPVRTCAHHSSSARWTASNILVATASLSRAWSAAWSLRSFANHWMA